MTLKQVINLYPMGIKRQFVPTKMSGEDKPFHYFFIDLGFSHCYFEQDENGWFMCLGDSNRKYYNYDSILDILNGILYGE